MDKQTKAYLFRDMQNMINEYDGYIDGCSFDDDKVILEFDASWGRVTLTATFKENTDAE